jgi:hypothetical protein
VTGHLAVLLNFFTHNRLHSFTVVTGQEVIDRNFLAAFAPGAFAVGVYIGPLMLNVLLAIVPDDEMPPIFLLAEGTLPRFANLRSLRHLEPHLSATSFRGQMAKATPGSSPPNFKLTHYRKP